MAVTVQLELNKMKNEYYESLKDKHFWYFLQPRKARNHYTYVKESHLFGLYKSEHIDADDDNEDETTPDIFQFLENGPVGEVKFYKGEDGHYYLDVFALFEKNGHKPLSYDAVRGISIAYNLLLPPVISGAENIWIFNTFGSTFKDIDHYCRFVNAVYDKSGNTIVLAEA